MKNVKHILAASGLMVVLMLGASTARAGVVIIGGMAQQDNTSQCTQDTAKAGVVIIGGMAQQDNTSQCTQDTDTSFFNQIKEMFGDILLSVNV